MPRSNPAHDVLARVSVAATGASLTGPVDRSVDAHIGPVQLTEYALGSVESFVAAAVDLHRQHPASSVTQADEPYQFALVLRDTWLVGDWGAALELGDVATLVDDEAAVLSVLEEEVASCCTSLRAVCLGVAADSDVGEATLGRTGGEVCERGRELLVKVSRRGDGQLVVAIHAPCRSEVAKDVFGVGEVVLVDLQRSRVGGGLDGRGADALPRWTGGFGPRWTATKDHHVDDDVGARRAGEGALRQSDRADEIGHRSHLSASCGVAGIQGVAGGERDDEPARPGQVQRLDEEVVVQGVASTIVSWVVRCDLGEGHVADHRVERAVLDTQLLERSGVDGGPGSVEMLSDLGGGLIELDTGHARAVRCEADEVARPAAWLQHAHPFPRDSELLGGVPHGLHDRSRRVVGIERRSPGLRPARLSAQ